MTRPLRPLVLCLSLALSLPAAATETERAVFDVSLRGVTAANVEYIANTQGTAYAVTGVLRTTGLARFVSDASYEATARGRKRGPGRYTPFSFTETRNDGEGVTTAEMGYRRGTPSVKRYTPPRDSDPFAVDPSGQGGTVDPMTAIWASLRDQPRDSVCALDITVFDGKRRSGVRLRNPAVQDNGSITCQGEYRRIQGWSPEKMAERSRFPFTMTYAQSPQGDWQVTRVTTQTSFGRAELRRR
ncbi:DUF3108 domain-containing protein [Tropicimonas sp. S265A]|uniref:DUF3108 domain-containing protein n=1 Tax=Tropicimonas sp. S265A TaxID=3415134 RepID=UPI003C7BB973